VVPLARPRHFFDLIRAVYFARWIFDENLLELK